MVPVQERTLHRIWSRDKAATLHAPPTELISLRSHVVQKKGGRKKIWTFEAYQNGCFCGLAQLWFRFNVSTSKFKPVEGRLDALIDHPWLYANFQIIVIKSEFVYGIN